MVPAPRTEILPTNSQKAAALGSCAESVVFRPPASHGEFDVKRCVRPSASAGATSLICKAVDSTNHRQRWETGGAWYITRTQH